jgi:hypothetical protein
VIVNAEDNSDKSHAPITGVELLQSYSPAQQANPTDTELALQAADADSLISTTNPFTQPL